MDPESARFEFPDVERTFFISPTAPADLQKLTVDLLWYLYSPDKGGQIDEYCMWDMGGCWLLGQSLHDLIPGSSLHWILGTDFQRPHLGPVPQHVIVKIGDFYLDCSGLFTKAELFQWWTDYERYSDVSLKPFSASEALSLSVHCDTGKHRRLVTDLEKYLSPYFNSPASGRSELKGAPLDRSRSCSSERRLR